jgi:GT2 family glycosyltransferase
MATLVLQLLTFKKSDVLLSLFLSLKEQTDKDWKLLVLDNGSSAEEREKQAAIIAKTVPNFSVEYFWLEKNIGFAGGHQFLYEKHQADYVMLVNDDTILEPNYIAELRKYLDDHEKTAAVSGTILRWDFLTDGSVQKSQIIDSLGLSKNRAHKVFDFGAGRPLSGNIAVQKVFGVSGCLPMYRRAAVGDTLFDPTYFNYKEDIDLAYRLNKSGWQATIVPSAVAYHKRSFRNSGSRQDIPAELQFLSYRNHWRNLCRHLSLRNWLHDGWAILPFEAAKFFYFLFTHPTIIFRTASDLFKRYEIRHRHHHRHQR